MNFGSAREEAARDLEKLILRFRNFRSGALALLGVLSGKRVFGGPRTAALFMTDGCNSRCLMCWFHSPLVRSDPSPGGGLGGPSHPRRPRFMDTALCETILKELHKLGTYRVVLGGFGEPALHPGLEEAIELTVRLRMLPYVITNGISVDEGRAGRWAKMRAYFRVSVHAGDPETWLRIHPTLAAEDFERLTRAVRILAGSRSASVSLMHVVQKANFRGLGGMIRHARSLGVREVLFFPVRADDEMREVLLSPGEEEEVRRDVPKFIRLSQSYGIRTNLPEFLADGHFVWSGRVRTADLYRRIPCSIGWTYTEFDLDGTMRPCEYSRLVMGRAGERRIRDLWSSVPYQTFREQALALPSRGRGVPGCSCASCSMARFNLNIHNLLHPRWERSDENRL